MPQFNGQFFGRPTVATFIDDSRLVGQNDATGITIGIIGQATGGKPLSALTFTNSRDARRILRGGELLDAVERAYGPGVNTAGAYRVVAVRVNNALSSTLTLNDTAAAPAIVLTSVDWGLHTAGTTVTIAVPGTGTGKTITVQKSGTATIPASIVTQNNVGRAAITVRYTGAGSAATMTIVPGGATPTLTSTCTGATSDNLNLSLLQYLTMQQVVDAINIKGNYTASVAGPDTNASSITMDGLTAQDIKTAAYTVRADLQAQLDFFNGLSDLVTAVKSANAVLPATNLTQTSLAGGSEGSTPTNTEWQAALDALSTQDTQLIVPVTGDSTFHAMVATHCQLMSSAPYKRERVAILGGVAGETVTQVKNRVVALNSDRVQLVWPGLIDTSTDGKGTIVTVQPYMVAAGKAGITAGLGVPNSSTNQYIGARGVETVVTPSQIDDLVASGVCVVELVPNKGYRLVQDITTWQTDTRYTRRELSTRMALDFVATQMRASLEPLVGRTNGPLLQALVSSNLTNRLTDLASQGVLVGGPGVPAFTNLTVGVQGDQVIISVQVAIAVPANFFAVTIFPTVFSSPLPAAR